MESSNKYDNLFGVHITLSLQTIHFYPPSELVKPLGVFLSHLQESFQNFTSLEAIKIAAVLLGFVVQFFAVGTTISLIKNMAPPKMAS